MESIPADIDRWRQAARIAARARELGVRRAVPGTLRRTIAEEVEEYIRSEGAEPAFPANLSRNFEAAHFTPSPEDAEPLATGDLLKVDVGAHIDGAIADTARTVEVGGGGRLANLIRAAEEGLDAGIHAVRGGASVDAISTEIEAAIHRRGLKPVRNLFGHTIERYLLHAGKSIPNASGLSSASLREGEIIAIEPFATNGAGEIEDGAFGNIVRFRQDPGPHDAELHRLFERFRTLPFTSRWIPDPTDRQRVARARRLLQTYPVFVERGRGLVAQAEHTVLVREDGGEVLTA